MALNEQQDQALNDYINKQLTEITDKKYYEGIANGISIMSAAILKKASDKSKSLSKKMSDIKLLCLSAQRFEINVNNTDNGDNEGGKTD